MSAVSLIQELRACGVELRLQDGRLVCEGPKAVLSEEKKRLIRAHKAEITAALAALPIAPVASGSPWEHFLGLAGDGGLVALYGAPVVGHFLLLLQRLEAASKRRQPEADGLRREYWASISRVEAARHAAVATGADERGQHLRCELEVLHMRWEKGVARAKGGWRSTTDEKNAYHAFVEIIDRVAVVWECLEQGYPLLIDGIDPLPDGNDIQD